MNTLEILNSLDSRHLPGGDPLDEHLCIAGELWAEQTPDPETAYKSPMGGRGLFWLFSAPVFPRHLTAKPMVRVFFEVVSEDDFTPLMKDMLRILLEEDLEDPVVIKNLVTLYRGMKCSDKGFYNNDRPDFLPRLAVFTAVGILVSLVTNETPVRDRQHAAKILVRDLGSYNGPKVQNVAAIERKMVAILREEFPWNRVQELLMQYHGVKIRRLEPTSASSATP